MHQSMKKVTCFQIYFTMNKLVDELEMKLEWVNVDLRQRKILTENHIEHIEKSTQTQVFKHRKQIRDFKTITPTPKSPYEK